MGPLCAISFEPPADWEDLSLITFVSPGEEDFRANILVTHEPCGSDDPMSYAQAQSEDMAEQFGEYRRHRLNEARAAKISGALLEHSFLADEGIELRQLCLYLPRQGLMYTFSFTDREKRAEQVRQYYESVVGSLHFAS